MNPYLKTLPGWNGPVCITLPPEQWISPTQEKLREVMGEPWDPEKAPFKDCPAEVLHFESLEDFDNYFENLAFENYLKEVLEDVLDDIQSIVRGLPRAGTWYQPQLF